MMTLINHKQLALTYGGADGDWVDDARAGIRDAARWTRGFFNGLFGGDDCHCYN